MSRWTRFQYSFKSFSNMRGDRWLDMACHKTRTVSGLCFSVFSEHKSNRARVMHLAQAFRPQSYINSAWSKWNRHCCAAQVGLLLGHTQTHIQRKGTRHFTFLPLSDKSPRGGTAPFIRKSGSRTTSDIDMTAIVPSLVISI